MKSYYFMIVFSSYRENDSITFQKELKEKIESQLQNCIHENSISFISTNISNLFFVKSTSDEISEETFNCIIQQYLISKEIYKRLIVYVKKVNSIYPVLPECFFGKNI